MTPPREPSVTANEAAEALLRSRLLARSLRLGDCLEWTGSTTTKGYGQISTDGVVAFTHRRAYETWVGPIPEGMQIDHLCRNPPCFEPTHLEVVTPRENYLRGESFAAVNARKTHCRWGHEFTPDNVLPDPNPNHRQCRACNRRRTNARVLARGGQVGFKACRLCGRWGNRGFRVDAGFVCRSDRACSRRVAGLTGEEPNE